jgi:hypothetical protein
MLFCPACGSENASDQKFCTNCGSPLSGGTGPVPAPSSSPGQIAATSSTNKTLQSRNVKIILGIVVAIAIVAVIVFVGLPVMKNSQKGTDTDPAKNVSDSTSLPTQIPATVENTGIFTPVPTEPLPTPFLEQTQSATKTYTSSQHGFSIDYPSDWEVSEKNLLKASSLSRYNVVEFYSPSINRCDSDQSSCSIVKTTVMVEVETSPNAKDIADYFVPEVARITSENMAQITKRDSSFRLSGAKAYRLDYSAQYNKNEINVLSAYTLINGSVYIVTYRAYTPVRLEQNQFELYYNTAMDMFKSFRVDRAVTVLN